MTTADATRFCLSCSQPLPKSSALPVCDACALEDALKVADQTAPLAALQGPKADASKNVLGRLGYYELVELLGRGGMGTVYKARRSDSGCWVAIKVLAAGVFANKTARERFKREAQALARLRHPGIVEIREMGEADGLPFFAMAYVDGPNLAELACEHPIEMRRAARIVAFVADAIQNAHEAGILHRDLKPSNILLGPNDQPQITDFGLARAEWMARDLTRTGQILGSPAYLAPEQVSAEHGEVRSHSDIYAIGAVLYHLLTGRPPFAGPTTTDTLDQVRKGKVVSPRSLNPVVPFELEAICLRCLEKKPEHRYPTAGALADALRQFVDQPQRRSPLGWFENLWWQIRCEWQGRAMATRMLLGAAVLISLLAAGLLWQNHRLQDGYNHARDMVTDLQGLVDQEKQAGARALHAHRIVAAQRAWQTGDLAGARRWLAVTDPEHRGWEHAYLSSLLESQHMRWAGHNNPITAVTFHPNGTVLASIGMDLTLRIWSFPEGRELHRIDAHENRPLGLAFSSDGESIVTGGQDGKVRIWTGTPPRLEREFVVAGARITTVHFDPTDSRVAAGDNLGRFHLWDRASGNPLLSMQGDLSGLSAVVFSPDGQLLATGGADRSIRLWSIPDGRRLRMIHGHRGPIRTLRFSPNGMLLASGSADGTVCVWRVSDGGLLRSLSGHQDGVLAINFSHDGSLLASSSHDGTVRLWDPETGALQRILHGQSSRANTVAVSPDGAWIASGGHDTEVFIWRTDTPTLVRPLDGHIAYLNQLSFSPSGRHLLSGSRDGSARLWNLDSEQPGEIIAVHGFRATAIAFSPDGRWAVTGGSDGRCAVWDIENTRSSHALAPESGPVRSLAIAPDGRRVASSHGDNRVRIWNLATTEQLLEIQPQITRANRLYFAPDGIQLYMAEMQQTMVEIWDSKTGRHLRNIHVPYSRQTDLVLSPDGMRLGGGDSLGNVFVVDTRSGNLLWSVEGHSKTVKRVAWSPDGQRLTSTSNDGVLRIWDGNSGHELLQIPSLWIDGPAVAWSPDGKRLAAATGPGGIWMVHSE